MSILFLTIYAMLFIFIALFIKIAIRSFRNPLTFFSLLWCVVGFVSNLGLRGYYLPSDFVNIVIIVGIIVYFLGFYVAFNRYPLNIFSEEIDVEDSRINYQVFYLVSTICIMFELPTFIRAIGLVGTVGMAYMRAHANVVYSSMLFNQISETFVKPIFTATTILAIIVSFNRGKFKIKGIITIAIIENIMLTVITAGRAPIVNALFYLLIAMLLIRGTSIINLVKREKKKFFILIGAFAFIIFISSLRAGNRVGLEQIIGSAYTYYFSGPSYLSRLLENYSDYGIGGKLMWGQATFGFIINWIIIVLDPLFGGRLETSLNILGSTITNRQLAVGSRTLVNSMSTGFYAFLVDWGYAGIIIGPFILAIITKILVKKLDRNRTIQNLGIYIFWIYALIRTVFKWDMVSLDFFVVLFTLHIFTTFSGKHRKKGLA